jgi:FkbM family methyltransferase
VKKIRNLVKDWILSRKSFRRFCVAYCVANELLPEVLCKMSSESARKILNLPESVRRTQLNQDLLAVIFTGRGAGYFVEIGANDGFTLSNTVYLEEALHWKGLLVEANIDYLDSLKRRKNAVVSNVAVAEYAGIMEFVSAGLFGGLSAYLGNEHAQITNAATKSEVRCDVLKAILDAQGVPEVVDFISLDIEGAELQVVRQFSKSGRRFRCGAIEHNYRQPDYDEMCNLLEADGYCIVWRGRTGHDLFFIDPNMV